MELDGVFQGGDEAPPRPRLPFDRRALADPARIDAIRRRMQDAPQPGWEVEIDEHAGVITDFVLHVLAEECPPQTAPQRQGWIGKDSWKVVRARADAAAAGRRLDRVASLAGLHCVLDEWRFQAKARLGATSMRPKSQSARRPP